MTFVITSTIALVIVFTIKKTVGARFKDNRLLRDLDLSLNSLCTALAVTALVAYAVVIGVVATSLVDDVSAMDQAAYEQVIAAALIQEETQMTDSSDSEEEEISEATEIAQVGGSDSGIQKSTSVESAATPAKAAVTPATIQSAAKGTAPVQAPIAAATTPAVAVPAAEFADGTYSGTGYGFKGDITVDVSVQGGKITDVVVTDQRDDRKWFERAYSGVVQRILSAQNENVDTVSGATYSSRGIIDGVAEALSKARAAVKQVAQ